MSATRVRLIDAALDLYEQFGFDATTVEQIADRAGIGRRTFFRYFPTKEAVLFAEFTARQSQILATIEVGGNAPFERLVGALRGAVQHPLDPARAERIRRIVQAAPKLGVYQRSAVVDEFCDRLVDVLAPQLDDMTPLQLRVAARSVVDCIEVAMLGHRGDLHRSTLELFDEAVAGCRIAWAQPCSQDES